MRTLARIVLCALLAGCAGAPKKPAIAPLAAGSVAPDDNLNAVAWTRTAIEHDLIYREVYRVAGEKLRAALDDPTWDALPARDRKQALSATLKPAVIVDIDETVLDNSPYQARLVADGKAYDGFTWSEWCREQRAKPLPGALEFAQDAAKRGVAVFYLSNRAQDLNAATLANLRADGFPVEDDAAFLGLGTLVDGCEEVGTEKGCRRELVGRTHRVQLQFGDQIGDFVDVEANTEAGRRTAMAPYADWIGERWFVLPNPTYGSWEPALFGNDWALPAGERRKAKIEALTTE